MCTARALTVVGLSAHAGHESADSGVFRVHADTV